MGLFGRRAASREESGDLSRLADRAIRYAAVRVSGENGERILGREGYLNCADGRVIICCGPRTVFDMPVEEVTVGELMSRNGATFTYRDPADGKKKTVTAYYTSYYK